VGRGEVIGWSCMSAEGGGGGVMAGGGGGGGVVAGGGGTVVNAVSIGDRVGLSGGGGDGVNGCGVGNGGGGSGVHGRGLGRRGSRRRRASSWASRQRVTTSSLAKAASRRSSVANDE